MYKQVKCAGELDGPHQDFGDITHCCEIYI